jgi:3,4-dihydroxy 2-butanone 4-phosphate synthase/GTP cyclohydrolase II
VIRTLPRAAASVTVDAAVAELRRGRMVIVTDDEDRENEGDLIMAAQFCEAEHVAFMRQHGSGVICVPMQADHLERLALPQMVDRNEAPLRTAFTVSVDAKAGTTTGISAADRALTIRLLADPTATADHFARPGHVFPLQARAGGVLERPGQTEAALDLCALAGLAPVAAICEITNEDGSMARRPELRRLARRHDFTLLSVRDLISYRLAREEVVDRVASSSMPTRYGEFTAHRYRPRFGGAEYLALTFGEVRGRAVPAHVHEQCVAGDTFDSLECDCRERTEAALRRIATLGRGVFVYTPSHDEHAQPIADAILRALGARRAVAVESAHTAHASARRAMA